MKRKEAVFGILIAVLMVIMLFALLIFKSRLAQSRPASGAMKKQSTQEPYSSRVREYEQKLRSDPSTLYMADSLHGWVSSKSGIFRTVDGGKTWRKVSDSFWEKVKPDYRVSFADADHAAVLYIPRPVAGSIVRIACFATANGGKSWSCSVVSEGNIEERARMLHLQLFDRAQGMLIAARDAAAGSLYCDVFSTADGGFTWHKSNQDAVRFADGTSLSFAFTDQLTGTLLTAESPYGNTSQFTSDGGVTWSKPVIVFTARYGLSGLQPAFMGKENKIVLLSCQNGVDPLSPPAHPAAGEGESSIFSEFVPLTPQGEAGAKIADFVADYPVPKGLISFPSARRGYFIAISGGESTLFRLDTAEKRLVPVSRQGFLKNARQIQFLNERVGFVLCDGQFLVTSNGGVSWRAYPIPETTAGE